MSAFADGVGCTQALVRQGETAIVFSMAKTTIAIELEAALLDALDAQVLERRFPTRDEAIETALRERIRRSTGLAEQCALLDPDEERRLAAEGLSPPSADWLV